MRLQNVHVYMWTGARGLSNLFANQQAFSHEQAAISMQIICTLNTPRALICTSVKALTKDLQCERSLIRGSLLYRQICKELL